MRKTCQVLLIDHQDSFTQNIAHVLHSLGCKVRIWDHRALAARLPQTQDWLLEQDGIVLSPGPGHPQEYRQFHAKLLHTIRHEAPRKPLFGVCLGLQSLLFESGARLLPYAPDDGRYHGIREALSPEQSTLPSPFHDVDPKGTVIYYNSLRLPFDSVRESCGKDWILVPTASTPLSVALASHRTYPWSGVQFHPESYASQVGRMIVKAFVNQCQFFSDSETRSQIEEKVDAVC